MNKSRISTVLKITGKLLLATARIVAAIITWLVKCLAKFPNAAVCTIIGLAVTYGMAQLPGILSMLWYAAAAGTLVLAIRGAWIDLGVTGSESRIAARTADVISRASQKDQQ